MQAAYRFRQTSRKNSRAACPCVFSKRNAQQLTPAHALLSLCACMLRVRVRTKRVRVFSKAGRTPVYHFVTVMGETTQATDAAITIATTILMASIASDCYTNGNNEPSFTIAHYARNVTNLEKIRRRFAYSFPVNDLAFDSPRYDTGCHARLNIERVRSPAASTRTLSFVGSMKSDIQCERPIRVRGGTTHGTRVRGNVPAA